MTAKVTSRSLQSDRGTALILVASQVAAATGAFAVNLLASRVMNPEERGELAFALQLAYFACVLAMMGLERPFISAQAGPFDAQYATFVRLIAPGPLILAPAVVVAVLATPLSPEWLWFGALLVGSYVATDTLSRSVRVAYITSRRIQPFAVTAIATQVVIVAGAATLAFLKVDDSVVWMSLYAGSGIVPITICVAAFRRGVNNSSLSTSESRSLRKRGWRLMPYALGNTAMLRSDRVLLPYLSSSAELGLYVTVATVMEMASWPVQQWVDASLRRWSRVSGSQRLPLFGVLTSSVLVIVAIAAALSGLSFFVITFLLPAQYFPATEAIFPLAVASVIYGITRVEQGLLLAVGFSGRVSLAEIFGMTLAVASYVTLIPSFGMMGAAYGSVIGYAACALAAGGMLWRQVKRSSRQAASH